MPKPRTPKRYRCRFCGVTFSAWLAVPGEPDGALLLGHIRQSHSTELKPYLDQMHTDDDITPAILQAYELVEEGHASARQERRPRRPGGARS
jgi:ligand-binding sensor protein